MSFICAVHIKHEFSAVEYISVVKRNDVRITFVKQPEMHISGKRYYLFDFAEIRYLSVFSSHNLSLGFAVLSFGPLIKTDSPEC